MYGLIYFSLDYKAGWGVGPQSLHGIPLSLPSQPLSLKDGPSPSPCTGNWPRAWPWPWPVSLSLALEHGPGPGVWPWLV